MTLTLEIAPEIEAALREEAERQGTTPELLAQKALRDRFAAPSSAERNLRSGDELQVRLKMKNGTGHIEGSDQTALQAKFERFFEDLETLTFEKPTQFPSGDQVETAFTEIMDKKYHKLGFKP